MSRNRALGSPYQLLVVTESFTVDTWIDAYYVGALPLTATLNPYAVNQDQVLIQDITGDAGTTPITIEASPGQTIAGESSITINVNDGGVILTYVQELSDWIPEFFSGTGVPGSGGSSSLPPRISGIGPASNTGVPAPAALPGGGTAGVVNGSAHVTFSNPQTLAVNDLLVFADGSNQPYQLAAAVAGASSGTLTTPYGSGATNPAIATKTVPAADFMLDLGPLTGLPTTGYTINVQGTVQWNNTGEVGSEILKIYIEGVSPVTGPPDGYTVTVALPPSSGVQPVPFNVDIPVASPSPTSFHATLMAIDVTTGASSGTISSGTNSIFMSVTRVE